MPALTQNKTGIFAAGKLQLVPGFIYVQAVLWLCVLKGNIYLERGNVKLLYNPSLLLIVDQLINF